MFEFIKWCFQDMFSGVVTLIVCGIAIDSLIELIKVIKGKQNDD